MNYSSTLSSVLFPFRCVMCGGALAPGENVCPACRKENALLTGKRCRSCGLPEDRCSCEGCARKWSGVTAPFVYDGGAGQGILRWKYGKRTGDTRFWAAAVAWAVKDSFKDVVFDFIAYVPQTEADTLRKGYNQGELLAKAAGAYLGLPVENALRKLYETGRQHDLPSVMRSGNVFGVFEPTDRFLPAGRTVLLIDDIFTTGATLEECAKMLLLYDAAEVYCAAAAVRE